MTSRRKFIQLSVASVAVLASAKTVLAQPVLSETDPQAQALGYVSDFNKVDKAKFPKYQPGQECDNCQLYTAKDETSGTCSAFPGKLVQAKGWCNLWVKKVG